MIQIFIFIFLKLLDLGIVYKENFDAEEDSKFHLDTFANEKRENATLKERREREEKSKDDSLKAYEEWLQLKSMRESALKYLGLVIPPVLIVSSREMGVGIAGGGGGGGSVTAFGSALDKKDEGIALVIEVNYKHLYPPCRDLNIYLSLILLICFCSPSHTVSFTSSPSFSSSQIQMISSLVFPFSVSSSTSSSVLNDL